MLLSVLKIIALDRFRNFQFLKKIFFNLTAYLKENLQIKILKIYILFKKNNSFLFVKTNFYIQKQDMDNAACSISIKNIHNGEKRCIDTIKNINYFFNFLLKY